MQSIADVDDKFLELIDKMYLQYSTQKNEVDFFDNLPLEIQKLLMESRRQVRNGEVRPHSEVMAEFREKYSDSERNV